MSSIVGKTLQTHVSLSTLYSAYLALYNYVRYLITLKIIIKEVIDNLGIDIDNMEFVSRSTLYEENTSTIVLVKIPRINPTSNHIVFRYNWLRRTVKN